MLRTKETGCFRELKAVASVLFSISVASYTIIIMFGNLLLYNITLVCDNVDIIVPSSYSVLFNYEVTLTVDLLS